MLSNNNVGDSGAVAVAKALGSRASALLRIDLSFNKVGDRGASALATSLRGNTILTELMLNSNQMTLVGAKAIEVALLCCNAAISQLDITDNPLDPKGVRAN